MKTNRYHQIFWIAFVVASLACCDRKTKTPVNVRPASVGVLKNNLITEDILDCEYRPGMLQTEIEARLGKPFSYKESRGRLEATYYIDKELTDVAELSEFTLVYENGKLKFLRKTWLAK